MIFVNASARMGDVVVSLSSTGGTGVAVKQLLTAAVSSGDPHSVWSQLDAIVQVLNEVMCTLEQGDLQEALFETGHLSWEI